MKGELHPTKDCEAEFLNTDGNVGCGLYTSDILRSTIVLGRSSR